jgi:hypothetical protein
MTTIMAENLEHGQGAGGVAKVVEVEAEGDVPREDEAGELKNK